MKKTIAFSLVMLLLFSVPSFAYYKVFPTPTLSGTSGLIRVPSADVVPYKNYTISVDYGRREFTDTELLSYKLNLGTFQGVEVGIVGGNGPAMSTSTNANQLHEGVFLNLKLGLSTEDSEYPLKLAIGLENLASFTQTDVYMVATKYFEQGPKVTFGFMGDFPGNKFRPLGVLGLDIPTMNSQFLILGDLIMGETIFQVDAGIRFYLTPLFSINVNGINILDDRQNAKGRDPKAILFGISWANPI